MRYRITIFGCCGDGNAGDECLVEATANFLRTVLPDKVEIHALSGNPEETRVMHDLDSVLCLNSFKPSHWYGLFGKGEFSKMWKLLRGSDLLLIGAGDLLRDDVGMLAYLGIVEKAIWAKMMGVPFALWGIGIGPLRTAWGRKLTRWLLRNCTFAYFRDAKSLARARELDGFMSEAKYFGFADIAFSTVCTSNTRDTHPPSTRPVVAVSVVDLERLPNRVPAEKASWNGYLDDFGCLISQFLNQNCEVRLLPFDRADVSVTRKLAATINHPRLTVRDCGSSPSEIRKELNQVQAMIGMRLHSWIMAMASGVPSVAFVYDEKVERTISSLGLAECAISLDQKQSRRSADEISQILGRCKTLLPSKQEFLRKQFEQMKATLSPAICAALRSNHHKQFSASQGNDDPLQGVLETSVASGKRLHAASSAREIQTFET